MSTFAKNLARLTREDSTLSEGVYTGTLPDGSCFKITPITPASIFIKNREYIVRRFTMNRITRKLIVAPDGMLIGYYLNENVLHVGLMADNEDGKFTPLAQVEYSA